MSAITAASTTATSSSILATGSLNPTHTSTLSVTYASYPTPWPFLLGSIVITIALGHIGWTSAFRSWHPHADMKHLMPQPGTDLYVEMKNKIPERRNSNGDVIHPSRWDLAALQDSHLYRQSDDTRPDGGAGVGRMKLALFGAAWTTLRVICTFALVLTTTVNMESSLPDPTNVVLLLTVCQIYMASRGYPRAVNLLMAFNVLLIFIATIMSSWARRTNSDYYGKVKVLGGDCPFFWTNQCPLQTLDSLSKNMTILGCLRNSTWNESAMGYPRGAFFDPRGHADPNFNTFMYINRQLSLYGGLVIAIIAFLWTLYLTMQTRPWTDLKCPFPELKFARFGKGANTMSNLCYFLLYSIVLYLLLGHMLSELKPDAFTYVDSFGPPVNTSDFIYFPGSAAWNQSHDGADTNAQFLGGNSTTWSDCFTISSPRSTTGHFAEWWQSGESKALRVLALL